MIVKLQVRGEDCELVATAHVTIIHRKGTERHQQVVDVPLTLDHDNLGRLLLIPNIRGVLDAIEAMQAEKP